MYSPILKPQFVAMLVRYFVPFIDDEEMECDGVIDPGIEYIPPPSGPVGMIRKKVKAPEQIKQEVESEEEKTEKLEGDVENSDNVRSRDNRKGQMSHKDNRSIMPKYTPVSIYEEKLLLRNLEAYPHAIAVTPEARRLQRKLIVRQTKRERGLPLFDLDNVVNAALLLVDRIYGAKDGSVSCSPAGHAMYRTTSQDFRILDRYQVRVSKYNFFKPAPILWIMV